MKEDRLVSTLGHITDGGIKPLEMVGQIVGIERPEVLFVGKDIHDLRLVGILRERLKRGYNPFYRGAVADNIDFGENYAAIEVHERIVA